MPLFQSTAFRALKPLLISTVMVFAINATAANDRVGEVEARLDTLSFYPEVYYQQLELTVAGNETRWQQTFGPNEIAEFSLPDQPLADGLYRYESLASPPVDEATREFARSDRELILALDQLEQESTFRQVGRFEVVDGEILLLKDAEEIQRVNMSDNMQKGEIR